MDIAFAFTTEDAEEPIQLLTEPGRDRPTMILPRAEPVLPTRFSFAD
ncbi:hypothetical protein [Streptomyces nojiriensis]